MTQLLTPKEAAARLRISTRQLQRLPIKRIYLGRLPRYREEAIAAYVAKREREGKAA